MYKQFLIALMLVIVFFSCKINNKNVDVGRFDKENYWKQDHYLNLQQLRNEKMDSIIPYLEYYGTLESIYGNIEKAQWLFDTVEIIRNYTQYELDESIIGYKLVNALNTISKLAKDKQLIMINEAHHRPEHRVFTTQLLKELYKQGFSYIALEGLNMSDSLLQERGYPSNKSGIYIQNTSYANLIRTALELGIEVISYDVYNPNGNVRDSLQAVNIYSKSFAKDPKAKVLVHAGYGHICKKEFGGTRPMGLVLSNMSKTNSLVIDQTSILEHKIKDRESKNYSYISENYSIREVSILKKGDKLWSISSNYDVAIIHPPLKYINYRPLYLKAENKEVFDLPEEINKRKYLNHLVKIFKEDEPSSAVPIEQFELKKLNMQVIIPKGKYRIELYKPLNKHITFNNIFFN